MARLPDEVINRIKREVSLLRLVESQGYTITKQGKDYALCCPFHDDKEPSCIISPKNNLFNCFGCGAAGSVIDWVMKTQGVSFRFACELLDNDIGAVTAAGVKTVRKNTTTKLDSPISESSDDHQVLRDVIEYYHQTLKESPEALAYLEERGINDPELIDRFKLGFANRSLGYRLPERVYKAGKIIRGQLQSIGILRESGHEHFNGSLVIPIIDQHGMITEVYGRKVTKGLRPGTPEHVYLPGPHHGVWNVEALQASKEVILCEALIDAMTFWVHGFRNVTASYGVNGFTADHLSAFKQYGIERVLIAYDRDDAGNKAAEELASKLKAEGFDCFRILFPKGMDANEYARNVTPAAKSLALVIRQAEWMGESKLTADSQLLTVETKAKERFAAEIKTLAEQVRTLDQNQPAAKSEMQDSASLLAAVPEPAATVKPAMAIDVEAETSEHEVIINLQDRRYRIRGLPKNLSYDQLKVNVLVSQGEAFHVDQLDLYSARHRAVYIKQAASELNVSEEVLKRDLGKVLLKLEELQERQIQETLSPQDKAPDLSDAEKQAALELLKDSKLLDRVLTDFDTLGVVGEETNKLVGYLAGVSRKLDKPLAVIIQSSSAAGKSSLMDAVLNLMPEEERVQYSAMTGQSLFYMGETNLQHKILAIAEEAGAEQASYALKLLQSEGEITIASTGKDDTTGNLVTKEYKVQGPVMLFLTTTAIDIDEELLNRCLVLTVNETREQTEAIHARQRFEETLAGLLASETKKDLTNLHRNAQRLLKPLKVVNPYADQLTFLNDKTRTRRDHKKYLTLIRTIALLHQYQRPIQRATKDNEVIEYVEVTLDDIETANKLAHEVLGRTLDELPPQTRKLLQLIHAMVTEHCKVDGIKQSEYRFSRRDVREYTGWGNTQLKIHCKRLEELEYVLVHRSQRGHSFAYELLYDGDLHTDQPRLMGLIDPQSLHYDESRSGVNDQRSGSSRPQVGEVSALSRGAKNLLNTRDDAASLKITEENNKNTLLPLETKNHRKHKLIAEA
jgi:DNA primase catalytic core